MLRLNLLPARQGDCLWITYGPHDAPHHLVVDGGPQKAKTLRRAVGDRIATAPDRKLHVDLLVVTHVDDDHIGGVLDLIDDPPEGVSFGDIWFNAYRHLLPPDRLGPDQGDRLSEAIERRGLPWNRAFTGGSVCVPDSGPLPRLAREDGLTLTLLGPTRADLAGLEPLWAKVVEKASKQRTKGKPKDQLGRHDPWPPDLFTLANLPFKPDDGKANASSIALLLEYGARRVLLAGDAQPARLAASLDRLEPEAELVRLDALKLSHHGSKKSTSTALLKRLACHRYLVSSDGSYFGHPDPEAMARVIIHGGRRPELVFNSRRLHAWRWQALVATVKPPFEARFPDEGMEGVEIDI